MEKSLFTKCKKKITAGTWKDLLQDTTIEEVKQTVQNCKKNKAAGHDGVDTNLLQMLTSSNGPLAEILSILINVSFARGKTLPSWRKAVITLIPKRKDDGSLTDNLKEMRPISVLQEFGKIASKILAERWGAILLKHPSIMTSAQRAFLKDGNVHQCIRRAIIFPPFVEGIYYADVH